MIDQVIKDQNIQGRVYAVESFGIKDSGYQSNLEEYCWGHDVDHFHKESEYSWLKNGDMDTMPVILREFMRRSALHKSAINAKVNMGIGTGIQWETQNEYWEIDEFGELDLIENTMSDTEKANELRRAKVLSKNICLDEWFSGAVNQYFTYGEYYTYFMNSLGRDGNLRLRSLAIQSSPNFRLGSQTDFTSEGSKSKHIYISDSWEDASVSKFVPYSDFREGKKRYKSGNVTRLPYFTRDVSETGLFLRHTARVTENRAKYGTPDYESKDALSYMEMDYLMSQKHLTDLKTGFQLDYIVIRYRKQEKTKHEELAERKKDVKMIKGHQGVNGKRGMVMFVEPTFDEAGNMITPDPIKIIDIPHDNKSERYAALSKQVDAKILNAHSIIAPEIIGAPPTRNNGLSSQSEYLIAAVEQLFYSSIRPAQMQILKDAEYIAQILGIKCKPIIKRSSANYKQVTDLILNAHYGSDEIRQKFGDEKMTEDVKEELAAREQRRTQNNRENAVQNV